jgi:RNA polymerase sigma-70 factor, ECF subfamily
MSSIADPDVAAFETHRRALTGLAYRMLGSRVEAEDIVQDAYLRWHAADRTAIEQPRRYLGTVVTRLCLDRMKSAQARRVVYVGQWLPEPVVDEVFDGEGAVDLAHDISVALMLLLERLSPLERAGFPLHDVFGLDFTEIARALDRGEAACRQLAARARVHIEAGRPRFPASGEDGDRLAAAFQAAMTSGDTHASSLSIADSTAMGHAVRRCAPSLTQSVTGVVYFRPSLKPLLQKEPADDEHHACTHQAIPVSTHVRDPELEPILLQARDLAAHRAHSLRDR